MDKNLIKKLIIIFSIIIIAVIIIIVVVNTSKSPEEEENEVLQNETAVQVIEDEKEKLEGVEGRERIYMIQQCISSYLGIINTNNSSYYMYDENGNAQKFVNENDRILNVLSKEYINKNNITSENISDYVQKLDTNAFFIPLQMKYIKSRNVYKYAMSGYLTDFDYNIIQNVAYIVNFDMAGTETGDDLAFSIEPIYEEINNIDEIELGSVPTSIEKNDDNIVQYIVSNSEEDCSRYLDYYKKLALSNPEEAYNKLDEEYRNLRFGSLEAYKQYIEENKEDMKVMQISQYMVNTEGQTTQDVAKDKYGKTYVFKGDNLFDISIQLDTYTIETSSFKEEYENGDEQKKVQMNIYKFILMINNQDFQRAYEILDENFRNNYFPTVDDFKNYLDLHAYKYNDMEATNFTVNGNVYTCGISLTDLSQGLSNNGTEGGSGYVYEWTFNVALGEGTDFTLSFEVK